MGKARKQCLGSLAWWYPVFKFQFPAPWYSIFSSLCCSSLRCCVLWSWAVAHVVRLAKVSRCRVWVWRPVLHYFAISTRCVVASAHRPSPLLRRCDGLEVSEFQFIIPWSSSDHGIVREMTYKLCQCSAANSLSSFTFFVEYLRERAVIQATF